MGLTCNPYHCWGNNLIQYNAGTTTATFGSCLTDILREITAGSPKRRTSVKQDVFTGLMPFQSSDQQCQSTEVCAEGEENDHKNSCGHACAMQRSIYGLNSNSAIPVQ